MTPARVLITGGTGFLGRWVVAAAIEAGRRHGQQLRPTILTRYLANGARLRNWVHREFFEMALGDAHLFQTAERFDYLIYLASPSAMLASDENGKQFDVDTQNIWHVAAAAGVKRALFVSSGAVYGSQPACELIDEEVARQDYVDKSKQWYATVKQVAEQACLKTDLPTVIARPFAALGYGIPMSAKQMSNPNNPFSTIAGNVIESPRPAPFAAGQFLGDALAGRPVTVQDGAVVRSYLYTGDLAFWLWEMLFNGEPGRAYNVGSERAVTLAELGNMIAAECGVGCEVLDSTKQDRYVPSTRRAREELGLKETVSLEDAVGRTVAWYRDK